MRTSRDKDGLRVYEVFDRSEDAEGYVIFSSFDSQAARRELFRRRGIIKASLTRLRKNKNRVVAR